MNELPLEILAKLAEDGSSALAKGPGFTDTWAARVQAFLRKSLGPDTADEFEGLRSDRWNRTHGLRLGYVEGLLALAQESSQLRRGQENSHSPVRPAEIAVENTRRIFVVHGHDNDVKETAARFLSKLGLEPIVLHEQPNAGRTIIEKFENYSKGVAFAVVLLTPDDLGASAAEGSNLHPRARQNVILELGYFIGRLGRTRVCAVHKGSVELPSDYQGVIYIEMDQAGAWKAKLAQELVQSKVPIDLQGLLA